MKNLTLVTALFVLSVTLAAEAGSGTEERKAYIYADRVFSRYDINHDRIVTYTELYKPNGPRFSKKHVKFLMKHTDTNKDGLLSESEIVHSFIKKHSKIYSKKH
jgi:Ca2+-binding EF-hand superfamily protein